MELLESLGGKPSLMANRFASTRTASFLLLAITFMVAVCARPIRAADRGEAHDPATRPSAENAISISTYVPGGPFVDRQPLSIVCELTNGSDVPVRVLAEPRSAKIREDEVSAAAVEASITPDAGQNSAEVVVIVECAYPRFRELRGRRGDGRQRRKYVECPPGRSVLLKLQLASSLFEPGDCKLFVAVRSAHAGEKNLAAAKPISLEILPAKHDAQPNDVNAGAKSSPRPSTRPVK
jgi:hypothetical protein